MTPASIPSLLLALGGAAVAASLGGCSITRSLVFPAPGQVRTPSAGDGELLRIPAPEGEVVALHAPPADDAASTVVLFHGNGEQIADVVPLARELRAAGLGALLVEYPGYGLAGGSPSEPAIYAAAEAALGVLRARGVPPSRTVLFGQSLGSGVATEMAARGHGASLVLVSPFTSLTNVASRLAPPLLVRLLLRDRFDSASKAPGVRLPVLIIHGENDTLVPADMGRTLAGLFPDARLELIATGEHNDLFSRHNRRVTSLVVAFASRRGG
jgi:uncharacterized protein